MTYREKLVLALGATLGLASLVPHQAQAGLLGAGRTVQAFYYNGVFADPEGEDSTATGNSLPAPLNVPVNYVAGALDLSTIAVNDTQIVIENQAPGFPFCSDGVSVGTACKDVISGFDFKFTGENILGVSVDPASAGDFLPVTGTFQGNTHLGLQLLSNNEIQVDVTGDVPASGDELILDVSGPAVVPAPLIGHGLLVFLAIGGVLLFSGKLFQGNRKRPFPSPQAFCSWARRCLGWRAFAESENLGLHRSSGSWAVPEHRPGHGA